MKLVMDEKLKHRLIGLAVVISLAAIFAPGLMKKSNQTLDNINVRVALPPKPTAPKVVQSNEKDLFKTIKIAKVNIPEVPASKQLPETVSAKSIDSDKTSENEISKLSQHETEPEAVIETIAEAEPVTIANHNKQDKIKPKPLKSLADSAPTSKTTPALPSKALKATARTSVKSKKEAYSVQLASFSKLANAESLVNRLKAKGYKTNLSKIISAKGPLYKVSVGHAPNRNEALALRNQLANLMQLHGLIVGVS